MMELRADAAKIGNVTGPAYSQTLSSPAEMRRYLLGPFEGRIKTPRPLHRHVWVGFVRAPFLVVQHLHCLRERQDGVVGGHLVERTLQSAFGTGAIVADDVDDQCVVELALVLNLLDHAAYLMVGVSSVAGKDLGLARIELLLDFRERIPP